MKKIYAIAAMFVEEMVDLEKKQELALLEKDASCYDCEEDEQDVRPYQVLNGIALYDIKGKMLSQGNWFTRMLGIATYDDIANALSVMSQDPEVTQVLIAMNTPGGNVAGISDLSESWKRLNAEKPVTVHTSGTLASAGVWLSSNSNKIYASEVAEVGSIGVVLQHASYQKQLEKEGVKVTTIKSAPLKYVGDPTKDLSAEELEHLQKKVDESDGLFKKQLYTTRPQILPDAFTGETFSASESLRLGLIDGINTFTQVFEQLSATAADRDNKYSFEEVTGMKRKVTEAMAAAAVTEGADPNSFEIVSQEEYDALQAADGEAENVDTNVDTDTDTDTDAGEETPETLLQAQVDGLTTELAEANASIETLTAQVATLESQLEASATEPLRVIAEERLATMRLPLGLVALDFSKFSTEALLAEYNATSEQFKSVFKIGGVKVSQKEEPKPKAVVTNIDQAHLRAVGFK